MDRPIKQLQHKLGMLEPIKQKRNFSNTKQQLQQNNRFPRKRLFTRRKMATKKTKIKKWEKGKGDGSLFPFLENMDRYSKKIFIMKMT